MAPGSLLAIAGLAVAGTSSAFLQPLSVPSARAVPRSTSTLAGRRSYGTRMTVRSITPCLSRVMERVVALCRPAGIVCVWF